MNGNQLVTDAASKHTTWESTCNEHNYHQQNSYNSADPDDHWSSGYGFVQEA